MIDTSSSYLWLFANFGIFQEEFSPVKFYHKKLIVKLDMENPNPANFCPDEEEFDVCNDDRKVIGCVTVEIELKTIE